MTSQNPEPGDASLDPTPEECGRLSAALGGITERVEPAVPANVDRDILAMLRGEAGRIRREARRPRLLRPSFAAAAAAALLLAAGIWGLTTMLEGEATPEITPVTASPLDVDASGEVDIVDAYLVARRIRRGEDLPGAWDVNADGAVNPGDVDVIARAVVSLNGGLR